jgi:hypothetical protein
MQIRTERSLNIGDRRRPAIKVAIAPKSLPGYLFVGLGIGLLFGFVAGSVVTLVMGEKSLVMVQQLWNRLTSADENGERVHFELLLQ